MANASASNFRETEIEKTAVDKWARENFWGWHYTTTGKRQKTAYAAVACYKAEEKNQIKTLGQKVLERAVEEMGAVNINKLEKDRSPTEKYFAILHNRGTTLQTKASNMVLTKPMVALVKGTSGAHVATLCAVEGHIRPTEAHKVAENSAVTAVILEAQKLAVQPKQRNTLAKLKGCTPCTLGKLAERETPAMKKLKKAATIEELMKCNPNINPATCAILVQSAAVLITGYEDAGAKFRDRASRNQAASAMGQAVRTILHAPL